MQIEATYRGHTPLVVLPLKENQYPQQDGQELITRQRAEFQLHGLAFTAPGSLKKGKEKTPYCVKRSFGDAVKKAGTTRVVELAGLEPATP